MDDIMNIS